MTRQRPLTPALSPQGRGSNRATPLTLRLPFRTEAEVIKTLPLPCGERAGVRGRMRRHDAITAEARLMRQVPSPAETALWQLARGRGFRGLKMRRMVPVAGYMAVLLCAEAKAILDLQGGATPTANDVFRIAAFRAAGWRVLSLTEAEVLADPAAALDRTLREAT